jgi:hypothetical protein
MGAQPFMARNKGADVAEAFSVAVREAEHEYGHAGYTGSVAEKDSYIEIAVQGTPISYENATRLAGQLIDAGDPRIDDKWGPAGAIQIGVGEWLFFGWASC